MAERTEVMKNAQNEPKRGTKKRGRKLSGIMTSWTISAWHIAPTISGRECFSGEKVSGE